MSALQAVLLGAADVLERDGWCQGEGIDDDGRRCIVSALGAASGTGFEGGRLWTESNLAVRRQLNNDELLSTWNDEPGRTIDEVTALLRATAEAVAS